MRVVINIPDEIYEFIKDRGHLPYTVCLANAIKDGIPYEEHPKGEWIPINSIEDIPKDRMLFVTLDNGYVETLYYDMTEWSDNEYARHAVAYMDYWEYEPIPYRGDV